MRIYKLKKNLGGKDTHQFQATDNASGEREKAIRLEKGIPYLIRFSLTDNPNQYGNKLTFILGACIFISFLYFPI